MDTQKIELFFKQFNERIQQAVADVPEIAGNEAINFSLDNFKNESWEGTPWKKRKDLKNTRPLLISSGVLRRSPRIISKSPTRVTVGTDVPYAAVHNNGQTINRAARSETFVRNRYTKGAKGKMFGGLGAYKKGTTSGQGLSFKAYSYQMPQRRFLGASPTLKRRIIVAAGRHINQFLK